MNHFQNNEPMHSLANRTGHKPSRPALRWLTALLLLASVSFNAQAQDPVEVSLGSVSVFNNAVAEVQFSVLGNSTSRGLQVRFDYDDSNILAVDLDDCLDGFVGIGQLGSSCAHPNGDPGRIRVLLNAGPGQVINDFTGTIRFQLDGSLPTAADIPLLWDLGFAATTNPDAATDQADGLITSDGPPPGVLALSPAMIDFGAVTFGDSDQAFATVTNNGSTGAQNLEIDTIGITGDSDFAVIGGTCSSGTILEPQAAGCTVAIEFTPGGAGNFDAVLAVSTTDAQSEQADLTGEGLPAPANIFFDDLSQIYTGSALTPTITTAPEGLNILVTYDGDPAAPVDAGTYLVEVTIDEPNYTGSNSANFQITQAEATISFEDLVQVYTGDPLQPTINTDPAGLNVTVTYDGEPDVPSDVGSYAVVVTIDEANYSGSNNATFQITVAEATISFEDLVQVYTGDPLQPTISTDPAGLNVTVTYDGEPDLPSDVGSYAVVVTIDEANYTGSDSATFQITPAQAVIEFANTSQLFSGDPLSPTITTDPAGLNLIITYDGEPDPPTDIGVYLVEVTVDEANYSGWNSTLFHIVGDDLHRDRFEEQPLAPGLSFRDCPDCPTMVVVPGGSFTQGSPVSEPQSNNTERPQRAVNVPAFAMGQYAVTFAEWDACVADGGCTHNPSDQAWGRGNRPVINVNWDDAQQYVTWLSNKTGHDYRLPSESEWEYATRAGTTGRFNTGDCITTDQANFNGGFPATGCPTGIYRAQTLPVGSFAPNAFGLYDTHGNTWEWVEDCWNENYNDAPTNGSAWMTGDCSRAVLRGGSWFYFGGFGLRSATRGGGSRGVRSSYFGFRVARSVTL